VCFLGSKKSVLPEPYLSGPLDTGQGFLVNPDPDPGLALNAQNLKSSFLKKSEKEKKMLCI
jgi:hypothetical protein